MTKVRGVSVNFHLVGRLPREAKKADGKSRQTAVSPSMLRAPRIDVQTSSVSATGGTTTQHHAAHIPAQHGAPIASGAGVLGFRLGQFHIKTDSPTKAGVLFESGQDVQKLAALVGQSATVEFFRASEFASLEAARERGAVRTVDGELSAFEDGALHVTKDDETTRLRPRTWSIGRVLAHADAESDG